MQLPPSIPPRFAVRLVEVGRERLGRCRSDVTSEDPFAWTRMAADLHALAGEASMMGLVALGELARTAEDEARTAAASGSIGEDARKNMQARIGAIDASLSELAAIVQDAS